MRVEIMRWVKFITVVSPLIIFISTLVSLLVFYRPLRGIIEQFNCNDVERLKIGPLEIVKRSRPQNTRIRRRVRRGQTPTSP
jgi:hypothetical protein